MQVLTARGEPPESQPLHRHHRRTRDTWPIIVGAILLLAVAIRVIGVWFALPFVYNYDESFNVSVAQAMVRNTDPSPHFFGYGSLFFEVHTLPSVAAKLLGHGHLPRLQSIIPGTVKAPQPWVILLDRLISVGFSVGIVGLAMLLGWLVNFPRAVVATAGVLVAVSPIVVDYGRLITPDTQAAFFAMATLCAAAIILRTDKWSAYLAAGVLAGLALATKYNAGMVVLAPVVAHAVKRRWNRLLRPEPLLIGVGLVVAFMICVPALIFDTSNLVSGISHQINDYSTGHPGAQGHSVHYYLSRMWVQEGPVLLFAPLSLLSKRSWRAVLVVGLFVVSYFVEISHYTVHFERNLLPLEGPLLVLAAVGFWQAVDWLRDLGPRLRIDLWTRWVGAVGCTIVVLIPFLHSATDAARLTHDERRSAQVWIAKHVPPGDSVVLEAWSPWVDPTKYRVVGENVVGDLPIPWFAQRKIDYIVVTERQFGQLLSDPHYAAEYKTLFASFPTVAVFNTGHPYRADSRDNQVDFWDNRIYVLDARAGAVCLQIRCGPPTAIGGVIPAGSTGQK
jgi:hypothetical protein